MQSVQLKKDENRYAAVLLCCALIFKLALDFSFWKFLAGTGHAYRFTFHFDPLRYAVGLLWCVLLFWGIDHTQKKASTLLLSLVYLLQIVPITTIYSLEGGSHIYYHSLCLAFFLCELTVRCFPVVPRFQRNRVISNTMLACFAAVVFLLMLIIVWKNGAPSLMALNIYKVYELRSSGSFQISKYMNYLLTWTTKVLLPLFIVLALLKKRYLAALLLCGVMFLIYLYTGHKSFLFAIPMLLVCVPWSRREHFYREFFFCVCIGFSLLILLCWLSPVLQGLFSSIYDLFCRRTMILSAQNKFVYYDYFSVRPKLGLSGIFPRWLIDVPDPLKGLDYGFDISAVYYNAPEANSNTGFLAEGYMRFGHIGTFLILQLFALLLRLVDGFQTRAGYAAAVGIFLYPVFALADGHLLDSLVLGPWMILLIILLFYQGRVGRKECSLETARNAAAAL